MTRIAINGVGRIGAATLKQVLQRPDFELVAVNDLSGLEGMAYLLRYDTVYGRYQKRIEVAPHGLSIDGKEFRVLAEKDPAKLPWRELRVDLVFECTGAFTQRADLEQHMRAGARHVIVSAPAKGGGIRFIVEGVNGPQGEELISCASCTTNCVAPVLEILDRHIGVRKALMTTVHAYTGSQLLIDGPSRHPERGRAGACNLIPTSTGAATATAEVLPQLAGKFDGVAVRVPVAVGSLCDITILTTRATTRDEVNETFREEARSERYRAILAVTDEPIVSSDVIADSHASIVDLRMTQVVDADLVKVMSWYDNEWGYAAQMVRVASRMLGLPS